MSERKAANGSIRKLLPAEAGKFRDHLLRLDKDSRRMRFAHGVSDSFIVDYAERGFEGGGLVFGWFENGLVRGAAELRKLGDAWGHEAEAAFSVERSHQDHGIGNRLMGYVIRAARNRGVRLLYVSCLAENARMQAIARHYDAEMRIEYGEIVGEIVPDMPSYFSVLAEAMDDRVGYMLAVLDLQARLARGSDKAA